MACLRKIEGVTRRDRIRNTEIYSRLNIRHDIIHKIQSKRLRYFGHVTRMRDERYPKLAVNGYVHGKRKKGRPKKRWFDMIQEDCREMGWSIQEATHKAQEREKWRFSITGRLSRAGASIPIHGGRSLRPVKNRGGIRRQPKFTSVGGEGRTWRAAFNLGITRRKIPPENTSPPYKFGQNGRPNSF